MQLVQLVDWRVQVLQGESHEPQVLAFGTRGLGQVSKH